MFKFVWWCGLVYEKLIKRESVYIMITRQVYQGEIIIHEINKSR